MKIADRRISSKDFRGFGRCSILNEGKTIRFVMAGGATYDVPISYFRQWHEQPHSVRLGGKWVKWKESMRGPSKRSKRTITGCRRIMGGFAVRVYLGETAYTIPWDTVLMACEERYEHFGGLTDRSRRTTLAHHKRVTRGG